MSNRKSRYIKKDPLINIADEFLRDFIFTGNILTTPLKIDKKVMQFCRKISPNESPIFLENQPLSWSRLNYCNKNVEKMIQLSNGSMVLGYKIWYVPEIYIEAERHAIWCNPKKRVN